MESPNILSVRQQCPHLGLFDDPTTALAYPSTWNVCYCAQPPCSVSLAHQAEACIDRRFEDCIVYQNVLPAPMPREWRGELDLKTGVLRKKNPRLLWTVLLVAAILTALWLARDSLLILLR